MPKLKIVVLDAATYGPSAELSRLRLLGDVDIYLETAPEDVVDRIRSAEVVLTNKVAISRSAMSHSPELRLILVTATVVDRVDVVSAAEFGIEVLPVQAYATESVAQVTIALLLNLVCGIDEYTQYVSNGSYSRQTKFSYVGDGFEELFNKRATIVGLGRIGTRVATVLTALGMRVAYYSSSGEDRSSTLSRIDFSTLLVESDIVSVHSPLTEKTSNLFDARAFEAMKRSSVIVSVGRGGVINENDLAFALEQELIAGAALDVFRDEPLPTASPLLPLSRTPKLILTPHFAWGSRQAQQRLIRSAERIISSYGHSNSLDAAHESAVESKDFHHG